VAEGGDTAARARRGAARTVTTGLIVVLSLAVLLGWASSGFYHLELGEAAIIMRLGAFDRVERREGWGWHLPEPLEFEIPVNVSEIRSIAVGMSEGEAPAMSDDGERVGDEGTYSRFVQTADNNIVSISYEMQYSIDNPYSFAFGMVEPDRILHDATQAAVRQVIGGMTVDNVLIFEKQKIEREARVILQQIISNYSSLIISKDEAVSEATLDDRSPFAIDRISLQTVHPPAQVRGAFEDVKAAQQDEDRALSRARGDAREIIESARAQAAEVQEGSEAYKQARILESGGEAERFSSLLVEYERAPEVTRRRLYIETMEEVLAAASKTLVDPSVAGVVPIFSGRPPAAAAETGGDGPPTRGGSARTAGGAEAGSTPPPAGGAGR
jgi:membrane protease subunit HflK